MAIPLTLPSEDEFITEVSRAIEFAQVVRIDAEFRRVYVGIPVSVNFYDKDENGWRNGFSFDRLERYPEQIERHIEVIFAGVEDPIDLWFSSVKRVQVLA